MTTVNASEVALGVESFGDDDAPLVLLAGGTTMLSWPDALCERLAVGGRRVVRYDLRDSGESTTADPEAPAYTLRDLAADAAALAEALGGGPAHLAGIGVGGMVAQVAALDHPGAFSALTLAGTRAVAPGKPDADLPDHDKATMKRLFTRPMPDWTDREAVAEFAPAGASACLRSRSPRSSSTAAATRSSPSVTGRRSRARSPGRGCSSSRRPPLRSPMPRPARSPRRCSRSGRGGACCAVMASELLWASEAREFRGRRSRVSIEVTTHLLLGQGAGLCQA